MPQRRSAHEGSIFKRRGKWVAMVRVDGPDGGPRPRRMLSSRTQAEARTNLRKLKYEVLQGIDGPNMTVENFLAGWVRDVLPRRRVGAGYIAQSTIDNYQWIVDSFLVHHIGRKKLRELTPRHVEGMLQKMADDGSARSTVSRTRSILGMALDRAIRDRLIATNVAKLADLPVTDPPAEKKSMTAEEVQEFFSAIDGSYRYAPAWMIQVRAALRPGEVLGLQWADFDADAGVLHVRHSLKEVGGTLVLGSTKTPKSVRSIELPYDLVAQLEAHRRGQEQEREDAGDDWNESDLMFPTSIGTATDHREFAKSLKRATKAAGLGRNWSPHELRHTCISLLSDKGLSEGDMIFLAGWTDSRMLATYRHRVTPTVTVLRRPEAQVFEEVSA